MCENEKHQLYEMNDTSEMGNKDIAKSRIWAVFISVYVLYMYMLKPIVEMFEI